MPSPLDADGGLNADGGARRPWYRRGVMTDPHFPGRPGRHETDRFRQRLRRAAALSTVGISTLSGVSPKSAALERLAWGVSELPGGEAQAGAYAEILRESSTLWPDQHAHVIATLILDLMQGRAAPEEGIKPRLASLLLESAVAVAPDLSSDRMVNDSLASDVLKSYLNAATRHPPFALGPEVAEALRQAGLDQPPRSSPPEAGPARDAAAMRDEIAVLMAEQIDPEALGALILRVAHLPDALRGRMLAVLVNGLWNILRDGRNRSLVDRIGELIAALPARIRITPVEAYYNQLNFLSPEEARRRHPGVLAWAEALPEDEEPRYHRSRADLLAGLRQQAAWLAEDRFLPGETLAKFAARVRA